MIMKSVHKRIGNTSLPLLCGMVIVMVVTCIIVGVYRVVCTFKSG